MELPDRVNAALLNLCDIIKCSLETAQPHPTGVLYHSRNMTSYLTPFNLALQEANSDPEILPDIQLEPVETLIENYYASPFIVQLQGVTSIPFINLSK